MGRFDNLSGQGNLNFYFLKLNEITYIGGLMSLFFKSVQVLSVKSDVSINYDHKEDISIVSLRKFQRLHKLPLNLKAHQDYSVLFERTSFLSICHRFVKIRFNPFLFENKRD